MKKAAIILASVFIATRISGESIDEVDTSFSRHSYPGHVYPSHVNFNEIFSNSISMLADDPVTGVTTHDSFHLPPSQFSEFRLIAYTTIPTTPPPTPPTTTPKPRFPKPTFLRGPDEDKTSTTTDFPSSTPNNIRTSESTTVPANKTNPPEKISPGVSVIPLTNYQRGVLDLILPASRVKTFKDIFHTVKKLLSYTFRK